MTPKHLKIYGTGIVLPLLVAGGYWLYVLVVTANLKKDTTDDTDSDSSRSGNAETTTIASANKFYIEGPGGKKFLNSPEGRQKMEALMKLTITEYFQNMDNLIRVSINPDLIPKDTGCQVLQFWEIENGSGNSYVPTVIGPDANWWTNGTIDDYSKQLEHVRAKLNPLYAALRDVKAQANKQPIINFKVKKYEETADRNKEFQG